jgi:hypothetical protein
LQDPIMLGRVGTPTEKGEPYSAANPIDYLPPMGLETTTGSLMWWALDSKLKREVRISRRMIADDCLALFDGQQAQ